MHYSTRNYIEVRPCSTDIKYINVGPIKMTVHLCLNLNIIKMYFCI